MPATGRVIGTPASSSASVEPQTDAIDDDPLDSSVSETSRSVYGNSVSSGIIGTQGPLGERAVTDVAALRAAHGAGLADRERREVVVVDVALGGLDAEAVDALRVLERAERQPRSAPASHRG